MKMAPQHGYNYVPLNTKSEQFKKVLENEIWTAKTKESHTVIYINGDNSKKFNRSLWLPQLIALESKIFDVTLLVCNNPRQFSIKQLTHKNVHTINMETIHQKNTFTAASERGLLGWVYDLTKQVFSSDQELKDKEQAWSEEDIKNSEKFSDWDTNEDAAIKREIQRKHNHELRDEQNMIQHRIEQSRIERQRMERARDGPDYHAHRNKPPSARNPTRPYSSMYASGSHNMPEDNPYARSNTSMAYNRMMHTNRMVDTNRSTRDHMMDTSRMDTSRMDTMTRDHRMDTNRPLKMQSKLQEDLYDNHLAANLTTAVMNCMREGN